jgi:hypothetical protein
MIFNYIIKLILTVTILINDVTSVSTKSSADDTNNNFYKDANQNNHLIIYENESLLTLFSHTKIVSKYELNQQILSLDSLSHPLIPVGKILTKYDYQADAGNIITSFINILFPNKDANTLMNMFIEDANKRLYDSTMILQNQCLNIFLEGDIHKVFDDFSIDDYYLLPVTKETFSKRRFKSAVSAVIISTTAGFFSGDYITPISVASEVLFENEGVKNADSKSKKINVSEIGKINKEIWLAYSKMYCVNTFSVSFQYVDEYLKIIGDKVPYEFMRNFLSIVQHNVEKKIAGLDTEIVVKRRILENLIQKLEALKIVTNKMEELVLFDLYENIVRIVETQLHDSLDTITSFVDSKIVEIDNLKELLIIDFPITQLEVKEQQRLNQVSKQINDRIKIEIAIENEEKISDRIFTAEQEIRKNKVLNDLKTMEFDAFAKLYIYGPIKRTGILISMTVLALPEGLAVGGLNGIYVFIKNICGIVFFNPITSAIVIFIGLTVFYITVVNSIQIGYNYCKWMYWIVTTPFINVYNVASWTTSKIIKNTTPNINNE